MEPSGNLSLSRASPRRELQGPRPSLLKVRRDSHSIKKPPPQSRPPVIIYTVSPKVIHANRSEFMALVQRLTGSGAASSSAPPAAAAPAAAGGGGAPSSTEGRLPAEPGGGRATGFFPSGILSPAAAENFASGATANATGWAQHPVDFFNELSPSFEKSSGVFGAENGAFLQFSQRYNNNLTSTPALPSPGSCWDVFNQKHRF